MTKNVHSNGQFRRPPKTAAAGSTFRPLLEAKVATVEGWSGSRGALEKLFELLRRMMRGHTGLRKIWFTATTCSLGPGVFWAKWPDLLSQLKTPKNKIKTVHVGRAKLVGQKWLPLWGGQQSRPRRTCLTKNSGQSTLLGRPEKVMRTLAKIALRAILRFVRKCEA